MLHNLLLAGGAILVALVAGQLAALIISQIRLMRFQAQADLVGRELLLTNLAVARCALRKTEENSAPWNGIRKFAVVKKIPEAGDACSFYLAPHDKKPLPAFRPGQYLTFELEIPGQKKKTVRCYSLSDASSPNNYRVTIKRCPRSKPEYPPGLASNFFHDQVQEGSILDVKAPGGHFYLDTSKEFPVVLISGGVGITPCLSMLNELVALGSKREIWWFYGVRHGGEHIMRQHVAELAAKHDNLRLQVCYSNPTDQDRLGVDYQHEGRVGIDLFKRLLPSSNYDYYICGPGPMMESITKGLAEWGVPDERVHFEAFGPASVKKKTPPALAADSPAALPVINVTFGKSGKTVAWDRQAANLLEFATAQGVSIASGCCAGQCGTCVTAIRSGSVSYAQESGSKPEPGSCLACVALPQGDLVLDA
jgi:ferredoxin-NADP reductase